MLTIDRLSLQLPAGFEHRATAFVELIGARLAELHWSDAVSVDHLRIEHALPVAGVSDERLAGDIATALSRQVRSRRDGRE